MSDAPIDVEAELLPDEDPFELGYRMGALDARKRIMEALDDGSECSAWALDVVGSL